MHAVSWFPFGPDGGSARSIAADPRDHAHLYLGAANGWVYESHDEGNQWVRLARIGNRDDLVIDHILVDPLNNRHLVVGAWVLTDLNHPDGGLFISNDGGVTWSSQEEMRGQSIRALTAAPSNAKVLVAGTLEGVFRSVDSGAHWERISPKDSHEIHEIESLAVDPLNPDIIYAGTWHLPWKTTDGGKSWTNIKQGIIDDSDVFSIIVDPKRSNVVYASACSGIYKSVDGGAKFVKALGIPSSARRTRVLMQDPNRADTVYAGTTEGLYRTDSAGKIWAETTSSAVIVNDVYVDPTDSRVVLLATDRQGVLASDDGGKSFVSSNNGFSARQITAYTGDAKHPATVYVGVVNDKDFGGVFVSHTGGLSWSQLGAGLEGRDAFSLGQAPDGTILAGTEHGIYRLNGSEWKRTGDEEIVVPTAPVPPAAAGGKTAHVAAKKAKQTTRPAAKERVVSAPVPVEEKKFDGSVYGFARSGETLFAASSQGVLRSVSSGTVWSAVAALGGSEWRYIASARSVVAAASLDTLEISVDSGKKWQKVKLPEDVTQLSALAVDGKGDLWVGDRNGVYFSSDKGANWTTPKGLSVRNVNSLYYDEAAGRVLLTSSGPSTAVFAVESATMQVRAWDTGWNLRFVRPVGDHLVAATLFDGIVVQPRMVDSAELAAH
ncbi:MAG: hypothetical protein P4K80_06365 [Acidobacteriaceae bacterium]|nr:hypothetical protein [Acidobacteriaceae bacterium]